MNMKNNKLKYIDDFFTLLFLVVIIPLCFIFLLPVLLIIMVVYAPIDNFINKKEYRKFAEITEDMEGLNIFCYTNRKTSKTFIEESVLPKLAADIKIVQLHDKKVVADFEPELMSSFLYSVKDNKGFPYLLKIRDGQVMDQSVKKEVYQTIYQHKSINDLLATINKFYFDNEVNVDIKA